MFAAADLEQRMWLYALAYTMRGIIFWPPDRPEAQLTARESRQLHGLRTARRSPLHLVPAMSGEAEARQECA